MAVVEDSSLGCDTALGDYLPTFRAHQDPSKHQKLLAFNSVISQKI
jgi:hypothetical protein